MINMRRQRGMSFVSAMVVVFIAVIFVKAAITLVPMYWQNQMLTTIINKMYESGEIKSDTRPNQLKKLLEERLSKNDIQMAFDELTIHVGNRGLILDWPYEQRGTLFGNIDLVVRFQQHKDFTQ
ncbi:MAG: DUF4845 domain-containing protein [Saccharospirillaceae bacterium]|nr:DUF4845 domain-containing protein [Saccharospirillaceae bacterium]